MLIVISPSKSQDFATEPILDFNTQPAFLSESEILIKELKKKSKKKISTLMDVSEDIASLNYERYKNFKTPFTIKNSKQALLAFTGDVYTDIEVERYTKKEIEFAQNHLRIISGLYGLLKPFDLIQPYRLEMKIKLKNKRGDNLYDFWGSKITDFINDELKTTEYRTLINLASKEYFKAVKVGQLNGTIITPVFKDFTNGEYKIVAIYAKRARGMMTNYIIKNKLTKAEDIKAFNEAGYEFDEKQSEENEWVFIR